MQRHFVNDGSKPTLRNLFPAALRTDLSNRSIPYGGAEQVGCLGAVNSPGVSMMATGDDVRFPDLVNWRTGPPKGRC